MAIAVMLVHTYYGYNASGGPVGVGIAVGQGGPHVADRRRRHHSVHLPRRLRRVRQLQPLGVEGRATVSRTSRDQDRRRSAGGDRRRRSRVFTYLAYTAAFTSTDTVTVTSPRAGLVMDKDAKVKYRGIQIGKVEDIAYAGDQAKLTLAINSSEMRYIPSNAPVRIASTTVFGAKSVEFLAPEQPSGTSLRAGRQRPGRGGAAGSQHVVPDPDRRAEQGQPDPPERDHVGARARACAVMVTISAPPRRD